MHNLKEPSYYRDISKRLGEAVVEQDILAPKPRRIWMSQLTTMQGAHENNPIRVEEHVGGVWRLLFISAGTGWCRKGRKPCVSSGDF